MNLRQLHYLIALSEELSFTRAAESCHVSQPPLSRAIRELESEIGIRLFDRDKHHVSTTPAGEALAQDSRKLLSLLDEAVDKAQRIAHGHSGTLQFGLGGSTVYNLMPQLVRKFREFVPGVEVRFRAMSVPSQIEALRAGEIDVGILRLPVFDELIETVPVYEEPIMVALPADHPLVERGEAVRLGDLRAERFVTYEPARGFNFHSDLQALCRHAGFMPDISHQAPNTEAVIGIVACGEGVAAIPASAERLKIRGVAFRAIHAARLPRHLASVRFALAWNSENVSRPAQQLIDLVKAGQIEASHAGALSDRDSLLHPDQ